MEDSLQLDLWAIMAGIDFVAAPLGEDHDDTKHDKDETSTNPNLLQNLLDPIPYALTAMGTSFLVVCYTPESIVKAVLRSMGQHALQQTSDEQKALARQALDEWGQKVNKSNDKARQTMSDWKTKLKDKLDSRQ